ncbi:hypothetical protein OKW38_005013 [Paraburkholderia sp. MM5496-R1]
MQGVSAVMGHELMVRESRLHHRVLVTTMLEPLWCNDRVTPQPCRQALC